MANGLRGHPNQFALVKLLKNALLKNQSTPGSNHLSLKAKLLHSTYKTSKTSIFLHEASLQHCHV